jgi:hypothetical protein
LSPTAGIETQKKRSSSAKRGIATKKPPREIPAAAHLTIVEEGNNLDDALNGAKLAFCLTERSCQPPLVSLATTYSPVP